MVDFVRSFNPVWSFVDLDGNQCDDTFYLWVLENQIPYIPAAVYHTPTGTPWTDPIQLLANGTLPIDVYWDPTIVYRLELRQAVGINPPSQSDPLIYLVENYIPDGNLNEPSTVDDTLTENQITNGQFSIVNFTSPYIQNALVGPVSIEVAPGWFLDLAGTGNVELNQVPLDAPALTNPTNAPYALHIELGGGWSGRPVLRQRFQQNGMLWADKYVASSITARIEGPSQDLSVQLVASDGQPLATLDNITLTNDFVQYTGNALLPATTNADVPPNAYVDFKVLLPAACDIYVTSFQLVASNTAADFEYEQDTIDRQIDHTFHYYKPELFYKPIPSYLVGWDFPLNPAQFEGDAVGPVATGNNKSFYAWDQTIVFQSVDNGVTVARGASGGLQLMAEVNCQMAVIQYLDQIQAREILSGRSSVSIKGFCSAGAQTATVSLWATNDANLPNVATGTNNSIVATLNADSTIATRNGIWTALTPNNPGDVQFTLSTTPSEFMFSGWQDNTTAPRVNDATFFAIVVSLNEVTNPHTVTFDWISLCAGDIATRPAPKTFTQTLKDCEYFYEKSYASNVIPGTHTTNDQIIKTQSSYNDGAVNLYFQNAGFSVDYRTQKRSAAATISFYAPSSGTLGSLTAYVFDPGTPVTNNADAIVATYWANVASTKDSSTYTINGSLNLPAGGGGFATASMGSGWIAFHYVVDARLGIVN